MNDLLLNRERICEQRSAILAQNPQAIDVPFGVLMDYRVVPVKIEVISTSSRDMSTALAPDSVSAAVHCAQTRGTETYVEMYIPAGGKVDNFSASMSTILGDWDRIDVSGGDSRD
jgi:hypothetical protein